MLKTCIDLLRALYWVLRSSHVRTLAVDEGNELISRRKLKKQRRAARVAAWKAAGRKL